MNTITKSFTVLIELRIEIDNDVINIITKVPDRAAQTTEPALPVTTVAAKGGFLFDGPDAITIDEAKYLLKACRGTVDNLRNANKLTSYYKGRKVRLDRREVEAAKVWWSVVKGKV